MQRFAVASRQRNDGDLRNRAVIWIGARFGHHGIASIAPDIECLAEARNRGYSSLQSTSR